MKEFTDFLGSQPPFDALDAQDLEALSRTIEVEFFPAGTNIIAADGPRLENMWVIRAGRVAVSDRGVLVDELDPGDSFGHRSVFTGWPPTFSCTASEDTLCYRIPDPRTVVAHPERLQFRSYGNVRGRSRMLQGVGVTERSHHPVSKYMRPIIWVHPDEKIRLVAQRIFDVRMSCALIETAQGLGIVTDGDLSAKVATGRVSLDAPVSAIMSVPAQQISHSSTVGSAIVDMVQSGYHHLAVHDDGGRPVGVVRVVDLASAEVRDPLIVRRAIEDAETEEQLIAAGLMIRPTAVELFESGVSPSQIGVLLSTVTDVMLRRVIEFRPTPAGLPEISWMVLGSTARQEALPFSDVDTAIVYQDGDEDAGTAVRDYAMGVLDLMERCGLPKCPDNANATSPLFSRSQQTWITDTTNWLTTPTLPNALLFSSIVADSRPITSLPLGRSVLDSMFTRARTLPYLAMLLSNALAPKPPTGFVRGLVVKSSGEHRGRIDLKAGGLKPITSLARWLGVVAGDVRGSTTARLIRARELELLTNDEADSMISAYEGIYGLILEGQITALQTGTTSSSYINPDELDTLTRRHLRESFRLVRDVQERIDHDWKTRAL